MSGEIGAALNKQGVKITLSHVATSKQRSTRNALQESGEETSGRRGGSTGPSRKEGRGHVYP